MATPGKGEAEWKRRFKTEFLLLQIVLFSIRNCRLTCSDGVQLCKESTTESSSLCFTRLSFTWMSPTSKFMLIWHNEKNRHSKIQKQDGVLANPTNISKGADWKVIGEQNKQRRRLRVQGQGSGIRVRGHGQGSRVRFQGSGLRRTLSNLT